MGVRGADAFMPQLGDPCEQCLVDAQRLDQQRQAMFEELGRVRATVLQQIR